MNNDTVTHSPTHSLTHSFTHSLTHSGGVFATDYQYSQPGYQQDIQDMESSQVSSFPMKDYQGNEQLGAIVELLDKNVSSTDPPRWAEQLFQVTNALSDEVKTIKEIVLTNSPQRAPIIKRILTPEEMLSGTHRRSPTYSLT